MLDNGQCAEAQESDKFWRRLLDKEQNLSSLSERGTIDYRASGSQPDLSFVYG